MHPEAWMFISGAIVLFFLIVHVGQFAWENGLAPRPEGEEPFDQGHPHPERQLHGGVYLIGVIILGIHLWHGFASAFQSLGITHPQYAGLIKWAGVVFAIVIGLGFASFVFFARMATAD